MDLGKIREEIDGIDDKIVELFSKRMELCVNVAKYKKENGLPVFQASREEQILEKVGKKCPENLKRGTKLLFTHIMDISKCLQQEMLTQVYEKEFYPLKQGKVTVACPGTIGSNTHIACEKLFSDKDIRFYTDFEDVFKAVANEEADYGVLPIENSTAGEVSQTYRLLSNYDFTICKSTQIKIEHCLCAKSENADVKTVYSHEQALTQCSRFLKEKGYKTHRYANTALAAQMVSQSEVENAAAICSPYAAKQFGLHIIATDIANEEDNTTRFICVSKRAELSEDADIISISLSLPHTECSLYRLLTRFSFYGLNLTKTESAPVPEKNKDIKTEAFDVIFYLNFEGSIRSKEVMCLMQNLKDEMKYFKFLGNYANIE